MADVAGSDCSQRVAGGFRGPAVDDLSDSVWFYIAFRTHCTEARYLVAANSSARFSRVVASCSARSSYDHSNGRQAESLREASAMSILS